MRDDNLYLMMTSGDDNLYFTSIGNTVSQLDSNLKWEYFVVECLLTRWAKSTPSVIDGYLNGFSSNTFTREFFIVLFYLSTKSLGCGW